MRFAVGSGTCTRLHIPVSRVRLDRGRYLESRDEIPEPHAFVAKVRLMQAGRPHECDLEFEERDHEHGHRAHHRDSNMGPPSLM